MPHIQVTMLAGRSAEQKRKIATRMTEVLVEEAGASRDAITVAFVEVPRDSFARGGVLISDRK